MRGERVLLALAAGLLLALAFPSADVSVLAWIAFVPLLWATVELSPGRAFRIGWLSGFAFYLATLYWVINPISGYTSAPLALAVLALLLMAAVLAAYTGAFVAGLRLGERAGVGVVLVAPPLWVALEWLRSYFFIGFPWVALGYSQYRNHNLIQFAEVTGVYGVSALVVLFNAVIFDVLRRRTAADRRRQVWTLALLTGLMVALPVAGHQRVAALRRTPAAGRLTVGLVQGNIDQGQKWDPAFQDAALDRYESLTVDARRGGAELVVWPETAAPFYFQAEGEQRDRLLRLPAAAGVDLLFGSPAFEYDGADGLRLLNRAYLVRRDGEVAGSYDKLRLVPFGEYVPFQQVLFFVDKIVEGVGDFAAGRGPAVLALPQGRFGVLICYEGIFPDLSRALVARGADFLVNITNDAWFGNTSAPHQHLAMVTLRAIENRVPIVRVANTGVSAIVDVDGRIRWQTGLFETAVRADTVQWPGVRTVYTRVGDVFAALCGLAVAVAAGHALRRGRRPTA
jgi:apolipoprotein N-acyltransferase